MPPKGRALGPSAPQQQQGYMRNTINALTDAENRSVVIAVSFFAVCLPDMMAALEARAGEL